MALLLLVNHKLPVATTLSTDMSDLRAETRAEPTPTPSPTKSLTLPKPNKGYLAASVALYLSSSLDLPKHLPLCVDVPAGPVKVWYHDAACLDSCPTATATGIFSYAAERLPQGLVLSVWVRECTHRHEAAADGRSKRHRHGSASPGASG